jgi:hypothetical protein
MSYLESIVSISEGTGGTRRSIYVTSFEHLISIEELEKRRGQYLDGELTTDEAKLVRLLRRAIERRREGKDHPSMVWNEDDDA